MGSGRVALVVVAHKPVARRGRRAGTAARRGGGRRRAARRCAHRPTDNAFKVPLVQRTLAFGAGRGERLIMKFDTPAARNAIDQLKVVGKPVDRVDGPLKTTGTGSYAN
jgi:hypothetical protein